MKFIQIATSMVCLLIIFAGCSKNETEVQLPDQAYQKTTSKYSNLLNVEANLVSLDVYHFAGSINLRPVVIWIHGGGWRIGDKAHQLTNKLTLFTSLNYIFVSVNYRLSPTPSSTDPNRIKFPAHNNDVADAVQWVLNNIHLYGGDASKVALLGHSAGAHLVSLTGTSQQFLPARGIPFNRLKGIASIDTEGYDVPSQIGEDIYQNAFGTDNSILVQASPIYNLVQGTSYPKFFVAKRGGVARINLANEFINKLMSVGASVAQVNGSIYDHEGINDAIGNPNDTLITTALKAFLAGCF